MKKLLALVLASVMVLSLAACNGGQPAASSDAQTQAPATQAPAGTGEATQAPSVEPGAFDPASVGNITINFAWWTNQKRTEVTTAATDYITSLYPNIQFNNVPGAWSDYWTQMSVQASSNNLPDLMQQDYAYLEEFVKNGFLVDLNPYIEAGALKVDTIAEGILISGYVGEGNYAICAGVNAPALTYNKTLTDSLGITVPDNITWDEFVAISKEIYEKAGVKTTYAWSNSENQPTYYWRSLGNSSMWGEKGINGTVEEWAPYYQRMIDGVAEGWMIDYDTLQAIGIEIDQHPIHAQELPELSVWEATQFSNQVAALQSAANTKNITLALTSWPSLSPKDSNYLKPSQFFSVTRDAQNKDLTVWILNMLINDVETNKLLQAERGVPAPSDVADAIADIVSAADPTYPLVVEYLGKVAECSSPIFPALPAWSSSVNNEAILDLHNEMNSLNPKYTAEEAAQILLDCGAKYGGQ